MELEQFHRYRAKVKVKNRTTLRPDAGLTDGEIIEVVYGWLMEDTDAFPGQVAFVGDRRYWIPEEDLIILEDITTYPKQDKK